MTENPPVVLIHGLWIHASAWAPWIDLFATRGLTATAPGLARRGRHGRGHPRRPRRRRTTSASRRSASTTPASSRSRASSRSSIGHSFGGLIAQELLAHDLAVAAVAIDPAPIKGVKALPFSQLKSGLPVLGNPANKKRTVALTAKEFRYSFGNAAQPGGVGRRCGRPSPSPGRAGRCSRTPPRTSPGTPPPQVDTHTAVRGPLLLTSGSVDHTVPAKVTREVFGLYSDNTASTTEYHEFEGKGHSLTIDAGWRDVAEVVLDWLAGKGFGTDAPAAASSVG